MLTHKDKLDVNDFFLHWAEECGILGSQESNSLVENDPVSDWVSDFRLKMKTEILHISLLITNNLMRNTQRI
jgi:hypothetical protein